MLYEWSCDEFAAEWALGYAQTEAHNSTTASELEVTRQKVTDLTDGMTEIRARLDAAAERWMFLRHLFGTKPLLARLDVLIECAVEAEEAARLRSRLCTQGYTTSQIEAIAKGLPVPGDAL
jgi:hypothetical protein